MAPHFAKPRPESHIRAKTQNMSCEAEHLDLSNTDENVLEHNSKKTTLQLSSAA